MLNSIPILGTVIYIHGKYLRPLLIVKFLPTIVKHFVPALWKYIEEAWNWFENKVPYVATFINKLHNLWCSKSPRRLMSLDSAYTNALVATSFLARFAVGPYLSVSAMLMTTLTSTYLQSRSNIELNEYSNKLNLLKELYRIKIKFKNRISGNLEIEEEIIKQHPRLKPILKWSFDPFVLKEVAWPKVLMKTLSIFIAEDLCALTLRYQAYGIDPYLYSVYALAYCANVILMTSKYRIGETVDNIIQGFKKISSKLDFNNQGNIRNEPEHNNLTYSSQEIFELIVRLKSIKKQFPKKEADLMVNENGEIVERTKIQKKSIPTAQEAINKAGEIFEAKANKSKTKYFAEELKSKSIVSEVYNVFVRIGFVDTVLPPAKKPVLTSKADKWRNEIEEKKTKNNSLKSSLDSKKNLLTRPASLGNIFGFS